MQKLFLSFLGVVVGLISTACGKDSNKSGGTVLTGDGDGTGRITCASTKDATIRYTSTEDCQPGFVKVISVVEKAGLPPISVDL